MFCHENKKIIKYSKSSNLGQSSMAAAVSGYPNATDSNSAKGLMTVDEFVLSIEILGVFGGSLNFCGVIANLVNVRTFIRMGVTKDGMTLAFLLLSISDMGVNCSSLSLWVCTYIHSLELTEILTYFKFKPVLANYSSPSFLSAFEPSSVAVFSFNVITVFNVTTVLITVYLAVARCLCVARPLLFRGIISVKRTLAVVIGFFCLSLVTRIPVVAHMDMPVTFDPVFKASRPTLWLHPNRATIRNIMWSLFDMGLSTVAQVTLFVCVIIMARKLRTANEFRNSASVSRNENSASKSCIDDSHISSTSSLNNKDARIIQQLVLISTIFIVCNIPRLMRNSTSLIESDFDIEGRYESLYYTTAFVTNVFDAINSSLNLFVYYSYNSKFRMSCTFC